VTLKTDHPPFYRKGGKQSKKRSIPLCADLTTYYLHQSFAGSQPSAKDLLGWNRSANYTVTEGFKSLARKCNKINKNQLGKFCLQLIFSPSNTMLHGETWHESTHFGSTRLARKGRTRHRASTQGTPFKGLCLPRGSQWNPYTKPVGI